MTSRRLIEETFPLKKVSEDSKHEKNVRHGHISTLHIWPARRPLAACRAAIIAALLPDPGDEQSRQELNKKIESITRWGTENGPALDFFRKEIRKAYGGRAPRVLDMFAGGGAIPLEAMRLGCDVTAIDYNPVAWFILKCTLEFPQRLAGKTWPLPSTTSSPKRGGESQLSLLPEQHGKTGDLADHVRYWGKWVLKQARTELSEYYPIVNNQPTVAYLWARTVPCADPACGAEVPLLKTLWLCDKAEKYLHDAPENRARPDFLRIKKSKNTSHVVINSRRALRLIPDSNMHQVNFEIWSPTPKDEVPEGTMAGAKSRCPVCRVNLTPGYIKECGSNRKMKSRITAVVVDTDYGKEYRLPTIDEEIADQRAAEKLSQAASQIPFGLPSEIQQKNPRTLGMQLYGLNTWADLFTNRQLLSLITFVKWTRSAIDEMHISGYSDEWIEAITGYLVMNLDRLADFSSTLSSWIISVEAIRNTFVRYALQMTWDYSEGVISSDGRGSYSLCLNKVLSSIATLQNAHKPGASTPIVLQQNASDNIGIEMVDLIVTDPPYYNAIPYADLSDFFYIWLRRTIGDLYKPHFSEILTPKSEELALRLPHSDIPNEHGPDWYEEGMSKAFCRAYDILVPNGSMVIVFAHKEPGAWETLVAAMIQAGFNVTASWPLDTEQSARMRAQGSAALSSSIWLICRKRPENTGVGRYISVKKAMQERITERLRYFWDMGIGGPDFVWAAVGPALESFSTYAEVRRMDGSPFTVSEFLREVRRMVADFALGQILKGQSTEGLDEWSRYYLIHRNLFGLEDALVGECILLSQGYGLDLNELRSQRGFILKASSGDIHLAKWDERKRDDLGEPHPGGGLPMIDMLHRLLWLWASGDTAKLRAYVADHGLGQNDLFWAVAQALLEMAEPKDRERQLLEAVVAWGRGRPSQTADQPEMI